MVDDFSTDSSAQIMAQFSNRDPRFKPFQNTEKGIISALRLAYEKSKGDYIHRMDADDLMPENKLDVLLNSLLKYGNKHLSTGKVKYFANQLVSDGYLKYELWLNNLIDTESHWQDIYKECVIASPCWLISRSDLDRCEAFQPNRYPEDYDLVFRFYKYGLKVISNPEVLHLWRDHADRTSRNHEHYASVSFFDLKLHYFFEQDRDPDRPLVIWGAGTKGKQMAKLLQKRQEKFHWVSNNVKKTGHSIYDETLAYYEHIATFNRPQIIITVAQRHAKQEIIAFLQQLNLKESEDYYFFR